jgi:hypothetical protein
VCMSVRKHRGYKLRKLSGNCVRINSAYNCED